MIRTIRHPLLTEKNTGLNVFNTYVFEVDAGATKPEIKKNIERIFKVHVEDVRTSISHGKFKRVGVNVGRLQNRKKAFVTIREGESIELVKGV
ncbi:MAG: 50S ribosomal protein L23 [Deltaproteobacteria bacterium RIFCSPHIGHO2_12_FULL_43_9]|nr:MAG: 50S ribosomal protein L23 [Deltaproteobacteria bacterium RIFCSPHIGHO2_12_FULL_43_9]